MIAVVEAVLVPKILALWIVLGLKVVGREVAFVPQFTLPEVAVV